LKVGAIPVYLPQDWISEIQPSVTTVGIRLNWAVPNPLPSHSSRSRLAATGKPTTIRPI